MYSSSTSSRLIPIKNLDPETFAPFGEVIQNPATHNGKPALDSVTANQGTATKYLDITHMTNHYHLSPSKKPAKAVMNMFVCKPRKLQERDGRQIFPINILERHPYTPQTFILLGLNADNTKTCYLVIVAPTLPPRSSRQSEDKQPPYPTLPTQPKRTLRERLLGARPNPFTNTFDPSTTPPHSDLSTPQPKVSGPPDLTNIQAFIARGDQAVTYGPGTWHAPMVVLGEKDIEFVVVQYANGVGMEDCQEVAIDMEGLGVDLGGMVSGVEKAKL